MKMLVSLLVAVGIFAGLSLAAAPAEAKRCGNGYIADNKKCHKR